MTDLATLEQSLATLPTLGATVWWSLAGIEVRQADLEQALNATGFAHHAPEPPTQVKALRRALRAWIGDRTAQGQSPTLADNQPDEQENGTNETTLRRALIRVINKRRIRYLVCALVAEDINFTRLGLHYGTQLRIQLEKLTPQERLSRQPTLICTTEAEGVIAAEDEAQQISAELRPYWQHYQDLHISGDLSRMVRGIVVDLGAVTLRQGGGLYFVPQAQRAALSRLQGLIAALPTDGKREPFVLALDVPDGREAKRQMAKAVQQGFLDEVRALDHELTHLQSKAAHGVQPATIAQRLTQFRALRDKTQTYADLLGIQQDQIAQALTTLTAKAQALLISDELADATETAPPEDRTQKRARAQPPTPSADSEDKRQKAAPEMPMDDLTDLFDE